MTQLQTPPNPAAPTPAPLLAGKFQDVAALEKAYLEIQTKMGGAKPDPPAAPPSLTIDPSKPAAAPPSSVDDVLARAGLDATTVAAQWNKDGRLTDEQYASLEKAGFPKALVDVSIAGMAMQAKAAQASMAEARKAALAVAGSEQQFANIAEWAKTNLSAEERAHFNAQVDGPNANPTTVKAAAEWLVGKYRAQFGASAGAQPATGASMSTGSFAPPAGGGGAAPFVTHQEKGAACADERFSPLDPFGNPNPKFDRNFHEQVNARLLATHRAGNLVTHPASARAGGGHPTI